MIDNYFRSHLPRYTSRLVRIYKNLGLTPNKISVIGLLLGVLAAFLTAQNLAWGALVVWWLGRLLDGTDGIYARETNQVSDFGGYLDIVCDMAAYSAMILGFMWLHRDVQFLWAVVLLLYVLCITSALSFGYLEEKRGGGIEQNRTLRLGAGLAEGGETGIAYTIFLVAPDWLAVTLPLWIGVLVITILARTQMAKKTLIDGPQAADIT